MFWKKRRQKRATERVFRKMNLAVFPGGQRQIDTEADQLAARLNRRFSPEQTKEILIHAKARAFVAFQTGSRSEDSAQTCIESIRARSQGALDEASASEVYRIRRREVDRRCPPERPRRGRDGSPHALRASERAPKGRWMRPRPRGIQVRRRDDPPARAAIAGETAVLSAAQTNWLKLKPRRHVKGSVSSTHGWNDVSEFEIRIGLLWLEPTVTPKTGRRTRFSRSRRAKARSGSLRSRYRRSMRVDSCDHRPSPPECASANSSENLGRWGTTHGRGCRMRSSGPRTRPCMIRVFQFNEHRRILQWP